MRYHYEKPTIYLSMYGKRYICDHPVYDTDAMSVDHEYRLTLLELGLSE